MSLSPQRVDVDKLWAELAQGAQRILTLTAAKGMPLIENIYKLCTAQPQPYSDELYNRLRRLLESRVETVAKELDGVSGEALLIAYQQRWHTYSLGADYIHHIFRYLNQHWIRKKMEEHIGKGPGGGGHLYTGGGGGGGGGHHHSGGSHHHHPPASNQVAAMALPPASGGPVGQPLQLGGGGGGGGGGGWPVCEVGTLALLIWRDRLLLPAQGRLVAAMLEQVGRLRDGIDVPPAPLQALSSCLAKLGVALQRSTPLELYRRALEAPYLAAIRQHYQRDVERWLHGGGDLQQQQQQPATARRPGGGLYIDDDDEDGQGQQRPGSRGSSSSVVAAYLRHAEQRLQAEAAMAQRLLLEAASLEPVKAECEAVLLAQPEPHLLAEADAWLERCTAGSSSTGGRGGGGTGGDLRLEQQQQPAAHLEDLQRLHRLLGRIRRLPPLADVLQRHVAVHGVRSLEQLTPSEQRDPRRYVETLLAVSERFGAIVQRAFRDDPLFVAALDRALRHVINDGSAPPPLAPAPSPSTATAAPGGGGSGAATATSSTAAAALPAVPSAGAAAGAPGQTVKSAELLAKYSDVLLKKAAGAQRSVEPAELETRLGQLVQLFKYLEDKDVFQKFYTKLLARRLIQETSVSDDAERTVLSGLRLLAGYEYVAKLHRMFTDMQLAHDLHLKFLDWLAARGMLLQVEQFSVSVLTAGSWPLQAQSSAFQVPPELEACLNAFSAYYGSEHQGRRLSWLHALGKAELRTGYLPKRYELLVSNYQLAVLLAFNQQQRQQQQQQRRTLVGSSLSASSSSSSSSLLSGGGAQPQQQRRRRATSSGAATAARGEEEEEDEEEDGGVTLDWLGAASGLKEPELRRSVQSLVEAKILLASPPSEPFTPMHAFSLNMAFSSKRLKLKLLGAMQKEQGAGGQQEAALADQETHKAVDEDRRLYLQAAIVRIMKTRKQLSHVALVQEVIQQAKNRFQVHVPLVKKCIESLIEKEYLRRVEGESDRYVYLA